jgi:hypothetical protein
MWLGSDEINISTSPAVFQTPRRMAKWFSRIVREQPLSCKMENLFTPLPR